MLRGSNGSITMPEGSRFLFTVNRHSHVVLSGRPGEREERSFLRPELRYTVSSLDDLFVKTPGALYSVDLPLGCVEDYWGLRSVLISDYVRVKRKIYAEKLDNYPHVN